MISRVHVFFMMIREKDTELFSRFEKMKPTYNDENFLEMKVIYKVENMCMPYKSISGNRNDVMNV